MPKPRSVEKYRDRENHPTFYASMLPDIRNVARACGYAVTIHGSMARDFDLVAIPWTDKALTAETLVRRICRATKTFYVTRKGNRKLPWQKRPHGRRGISLMFGGKPYLDLSVIPRRKRRKHG